MKACEKKIEIEFITKLQYVQRNHMRCIRALTSIYFLFDYNGFATISISEREKIIAKCMVAICTNYRFFKCSLIHRQN